MFIAPGQVVGVDTFDELYQPKGHGVVFHRIDSMNARVITRDNVHKGILETFETLLNNFFASDKPQAVGLPPLA